MHGRTRSKVTRWTSACDTHADKQLHSAGLVTESSVQRKLLREERILEVSVQQELLRGELELWLKAGVQLDGSLHTGTQTMQLLLHGHSCLLFILITLCWGFPLPVSHNPSLRMESNHQDALEALLLVSAGCTGLKWIGLDVNTALASLQHSCMLCRQSELLTRVYSVGDKHI